MTQAALVLDSLVAIYSAMFVYAIAFICFTLDFARRVSEARAVVPKADLSVAVPAGIGSTLLLDRPKLDVAPPAGTRRGSLTARLGMIFTVMAWLLHVGGTVLRGLAAGRVPWANMF